MQTSFSLSTLILRVSLHYTLKSNTKAESRQVWFDPDASSGVSSHEEDTEHSVFDCSLLALCVCMEDFRAYNIVHF